MASSDSSEYRRKRFNRLFYAPSHDRRRRTQEEAMLEHLLEQWQATSLGPGDLKPQPPPVRDLGAIVSEVIRELDMDEQATMRALIDAWPRLVGAEIAAQCEPRRISYGILQVEVASAAQRFALEPHRRRLTAAIRDFTQNEIQDMRFVAGGQSASSYQPRKRRDRPSPPPGDR